jgi:acyl-CoA synthetase (AMP-forming)/AMP-acid ligase II
MAQNIRSSQLPPELNLASIRAWVNCSEPVCHRSHVEFLRAFVEQGVSEKQFTASYAMAENVFAVTQSTPGLGKTIFVDREVLAGEHRAKLTGNPDDKPLVSNGTPVEGTVVCVLDEQDRELPERHIGQLALRGETLFSGYHKRDDLTRAAITADGWYRTGDLGFIHLGEVYVTGRKKDLIIIQGRNFYPGDIEETGSHVPGVAPGRIVAFGLPDETTGTEKLVILAEGENGSGENPKLLALKIRNAVAQELDCTPSLVQIVPARWLIKSSSGKIARNDNRQKFLAAIKVKGLSDI